MLEFAAGSAVSRHTYFVDVLLPLAIRNAYTYRVPHEWGEQVEQGKRVVVQFGKNKIYAGLVYRVHEQAVHQAGINLIFAELDDNALALLHLLGKNKIY